MGMKLTTYRKQADIPGLPDTTSVADEQTRLFLDRLKTGYESMRSQLQVLGNLVKVDAAGKVNIDGLADALLSNNNFANKLANKTGLNVKFKRNSTEPDNKKTINITPDSAKINLCLSNTAKFSATTSDGSGVTWSSSDSSIAEVDSSGNVTAKATGNCSITAKGNNGGSASASVEVVEDISELPTRLKVSFHEKTTNENGTSSNQDYDNFNTYLEKISGGYLISGGDVYFTSSDGVYWTCMHQLRISDDHKETASKKVCSVLTLTPGRMVQHQTSKM
jgi:hypothetical protein